MSPAAQLKAINDIRHPEIRTIIEGFEGVVKPGEMLREYSIASLARTVLTEALEHPQWSLEALDRVALPF